MSRLWTPCPILFCVHVYVLPAGLPQTSVRGEELVTALPLPDLGRPGPWSLLHHLLALCTLEPGPVPVQTPGQHVDRKSLLQDKMCVWTRRTTSSVANTSHESDVHLFHNTTSLLSALRLPSLHLSTSFHPPLPPVTCLWHHHVHISPGRGGGTGASLTRAPDMARGPHMRTHHRKKTAWLASLDVYPHWNQQIATRGPENMSDVIPEAAYLTLVETQTAIPPLACTVCVWVCVCRAVCFCALCVPAPSAWWVPCVWTPCLAPQGKEIPFFWHPGCIRPLCELLSYTHKHQHTHMHALSTSSTKHTHCPPSS